MKLHPPPHAASLAALLAACASTGGGGASTPTSPDGFRPVGGGGILYTWSGGLDALLVDEKDAGVREALRHLAARLAELPAETGDPMVPGDEMSLAARLLLGSGTLDVGPSQDPAAGMPVRAQLTFRGASADEATRNAELLTRVLAQHEVPSLGLDEAIGLSRLDLGMFQVLHGVAKAGRPDTLVVALNEVDPAERDYGTLDLPSDARPTLVFRMDYGALGSMLETSGGAEVVSALDLAGVGDVVLQGAIGHGPDRCHASLRTIGFVPAARSAGTLPQGSIPRSALERVPADTTMAFVTQADPANFGATLRRMIEAQDAAESVDPLALLRDFVGVDLEADFLTHLGGTLGAYASDRTVGGGHASWIAFAKVRDEAALRAGLGRIEERLLGLALDQDLPQLVVRTTQHAGIEISTFATLGLPVPVEVSWAVHQGWLSAGLSVQGVRAAIDHAVAGGDSILDNDRFRDAAPGPIDGNLTVTYVDVPRFPRDAYPLVVMFGAALSNGLVSTNAPDRVPPGIVPGFEAFTGRTHATVAFGRIEGDDMVVRSSSDRSILVQGAGLAVAVGPLVATLVAFGAVADDASEADAPEAFFLENLEEPGEGMEEDVHVQVETETQVAPSEQPITTEDPK